MNDYIYVALIDENDKAYYYEMHHFTSNDTTIQLQSKIKPAKAGIDPYLVLIDRDMDNNTVEVKPRKKV